MEIPPQAKFTTSATAKGIHAIIAPDFPYRFGTEEILEVSEVLEVKIAGLAAERAQPVDIEAMRSTIDALTKHSTDAFRIRGDDVAFHNRLAAAGNPLFSVLSNSINNVMIKIRLRACSVDGLETAQRAARYHARILEKVTAGDVEGARLAMTEHLGEARETLRRADAF